MIEVLETERLLLRPLEISDAVQAQALFPHWAIVRYLNAVVPWPYPPDGAESFYKNVAIPEMERGEGWHWSIRLKSDPEQMIGNITLRRGADMNRGFWIGLPWQGQGYATEASNAATDYWFDVLHFPVLRVPKAAVNTASRRISERSGMRLVATMETDYVAGRLLTEVWEIRADEWRERRLRR